MLRVIVKHDFTNLKLKVIRCDITIQADSVVTGKCSNRVFYLNVLDLVIILASACILHIHLNCSRLNTKEIFESNYEMNPMSYLDDKLPLVMYQA